MKRLLCVLLIVALCLCGCDSLPSDETFKSPNKMIVDFELISKDDNNAIYRDKVNDVLYYVFSQEIGYIGYFGITPIYGSDGQPIKYAHEAG